MNKKQLEIKLTTLNGFKNPDPKLEQYQTPPGIVASIVHLAYMQGNIKNQKVIDLGCGTGAFAIAAKLMDAEKVVGVDIDPKAIEIAKQNSEKLNVDVEWIQKDVSEFKGYSDTVLQNPPFGAQSKGSDRPFIKTALNTAKTTYSIHNQGTRDFVEKYVREHGGQIVEMTTILFPIGRTFNFHKKKQKPVKVNLYKFIRDS
ncbi:METTL5 family protein [Methanonatronarchaeum sp. AMET-Sl]|uniref:METTL5 family protein n=1 Tax=Methanonatronarchaeum sp. AMET-Sl TaxID=3037654 RepID=UPI00244DB75E|nr:METTL5 family protein [Methanonatronarchaeum sp. AMET-Sl]WGI17777.1 METTL5 family protein [Methanonatronarchaeum sp. AMET-Sl]